MLPWHTGWKACATVDQEMPVNETMPVRRDVPMPVKYWSFAGLILTYRCSARCASCYLCCGPDAPVRESASPNGNQDAREGMTVDEALAHWRGLAQALPEESARVRGGPLRCRIHLTGGEPFGDWERLIELCERAGREDLPDGRLTDKAPLEKVETNAFWATGAKIVRERVSALIAAGMGKLVISADPYHQQYVPIERCRLAARVAEECFAREGLNGRRVQVRWRDWLDEGFDTDKMAPNERAELFGRHLRHRRERITGRAARLVETLPGCVPRKPASSFADNTCREALLRSRHVHVDPHGLLVPGTCAGIVLGQAGPQSIPQIWRRLDEEFRRPASEASIIARLVAQGPVGLLDQAQADGFVPKENGYVGKCHLCWEVRSFLFARQKPPGPDPWSLDASGQLGPSWIYRAVL